MWGGRAEVYRLFTVSVAMKNMGCEFFQPKGSVKEITTSGSYSSFVGKRRESLGASLSLNPMK